jgi:predicted phage terminase large subunit-like protein
VSKVVVDYLATLSPEHQKLLTIPEGRRILTKYNFKLFTLLYFRDIMKSTDTGGEITFSEFHDEFIADAKKYAVPSAGPAESRTAWICPRGSGKSTWMMMLIIWLAAHQHQKFIALFSSTPSQAEDMLSNIRGHFDSNELIRADYPELVRPATRKAAALKLSDNKSLVIQQNGTIITGRGINTSVLGMRIDNTRPSLILLDDIEAGEAQTASNDVAKLLVTLQDDILPLSLNAHVVWVGTTTRPAGLTEGLVHKALDMPHPEWVTSENFKIHYWPALVRSDSGEPRSIWEERWSTEYLLSQEHTRSFQKNYLCLPAPEDYHYWTPDTFRIENIPDLDYVMLSVDPAVTVKESSDFTGLAVVGYAKSTGKTYVLHVEEVKLGGNDLRNRAAKLLEMYPAITLIYAEVNQGGDLVKDLFSSLPIKVKTVNQSVKKEIRAGTALAEYEKGKVIHERPFPALEKQMIAFPNGKHDDMIDAVGSGVIYFSKVGESTGGVRVSSGTYA